MKNSKRAARLLFLMAILVFGITSCKPEKEKEPTPAPEPAPVKAPAQIVTVAQAKTMYDAYGERRVGLIEKFENEQSPEKKFDVARFGSYDYKTIKTYLAYIEQEAKNANVEISTLRFYFSNYPDQKTFENGREIKHPRQNSFFMIPTIKEGNNGDYAFYIREDDNGRNTPMLLTDNLNPKKQENMDTEQGAASQKSEASFIPSISTSLMYAKDKSLILNEGDMIPPPYKAN
ncbi:hypothetical protein KCTC52924_00344 [Arenibacter antarcticus]|uniref:Lipoprotein n=1 Tax=Arenibacter antarcticus TaxID=2040469 RepID=A0ABW5VD51_9FLAO|nr:hypothetical protein [Arenibacter sp. H213]MCM4169563.1 hypothetical protein [Arenibacter sp. H213]